MFSKYVSALSSVIKSEAAKHQDSFIIKKKYSTKPKYYALDWCDYKWVATPDEATVFHPMERLEHELDCTLVRYEAYFEVVRI